MLELPEVLARAGELNDALAGKTIANVLPPSSPHKFCWFTGEPEVYAEKLCGRAFCKAEGFGIYVEMDFGGAYLAVNDGVNLRYLTADEKRPAKYQLLIEFTDSSALAFSVAMYGGICLHGGNWDNEYWCASRESISPLSDAFTFERFEALIASVKPAASAKALLATKQRIPDSATACCRTSCSAPASTPSAKSPRSRRTKSARSMKASAPPSPT